MNNKCKVEGCLKQSHTHGYCAGHNHRLLRYGNPLYSPKLSTHKCIVNECNNQTRSGKATYCMMHYQRLWKHGDPLYTPKTYITCTVEGCTKSTRSPESPYCEMHYYRFRRNGHFGIKPIGIVGINSSGYEKVLKHGHPLSDSQGRVFVHRFNLYNIIGSGLHKCHWCGKKVNWELTYPESVDALIVDHIDRDKLNNDPCNLVPSCQSCNSKRNHQNLSAYIENQTH